MNWIKIATGIANDDKVRDIATACRVRHAEAVGLVTCVLTSLPRLAPDGDITRVADVQLEGAAMWEGKRGAFAKAFRAAWCVDGVVANWEKWNGAAMREFARDRKRKKEWYDRQKNAQESAGFSAGESDGNSDGVSTAKKVEGRSNYGNYEQREEDTPCPPPPVFTEAVAWVAPRGHDALARLLSAVSEPSVWVGILRGYASGLSMDQGKPCDPERLAVAIEDFVAKGKHREQNGPSPALFRAFVKAAKAPIRRYANQLTEAEERAEQLLIIRQNNERKRRMGRPLAPEPAWAAEVDAMFPDGRTSPSGVAA